jgi:hypothetical protein
VKTELRVEKHGGGLGVLLYGRYLKGKKTLALFDIPKQKYPNRDIPVVRFEFTKGNKRVWFLKESAVKLSARLEQRKSIGNLKDTISLGKNPMVLFGTK